METSSNRRERKRHPYDKSNWFSQIFFLWMTPIFKEGYRRNLEEDDLSNCPEADESNLLTMQLDREWLKQAHNSKKPSLFQCFVRIHGFHYLLICGAVILEEAARTVSPIFLSYLLLFFRHGTPLFNPAAVSAGLTTNQTAYVDMVSGKISLKEACLYAMGVVLMFLFSIIIHHYYLFWTGRIAMRMKISCQGAIYKKALRLSANSLRNTDAGKIKNLMTGDAARFYGTIFTPYLIVAPLQVIATLIILYYHIGWSCLISAGAIGIFLPFLVVPSTFITRMQRTASQKTDKRAKLMDEIINAMKIIKVYCWQKIFTTQIHNCRQDELAEKWRLKKIRQIPELPYYFARHVYVLVVAVVTVYISDAPFTSSYLFLVLSLSNVMIVSVTFFLRFAVDNWSVCRASLQRIQEFLELEEKDGYKGIESDAQLGKGEDMESRLEKISLNNNMSVTGVPGITVNHLSARWPDSETDQLTDISFTVRRGELLAVVGSVDAGKSSLLMSILRECPLASGSIEVNGSVGYSSQDSWIFSSTLRQNILFGRDYDSDRFNHVLGLTSLTQEVADLPHGDQSLIGENGEKLSGGQKARVNLCRAIYKPCDIYLLDDPLSAVDAGVERHIFERCIRRELKHAAVILVTNQKNHQQFIRQASQILVLSGGKKLALGSFAELSDSGIDIADHLRDRESQTDSDTTSYQSNKSHSDRSSENGVYCSTSSQSVSHHNQPYSDQRSDQSESLSESQEMDSLTQSGDNQQENVKEQPVKESRVTGRVSFKLYFQLMRYGASYPTLVLVALMFIICEIGSILTDWWMSQWAATNEYYHMKTRELSTNDTTVLDNLTHKLEEDNQFYSIIQSCMVAVFILLAVARVLSLEKIFINASQKLHNAIFTTLLRAPMLFFYDENSSGRISNIFLKDMEGVDEKIPSKFRDFLSLILIVIGSMVTPIVIVPWIVGFLVPLFVALIYLRRYHLQLTRQLKRLEGTTSSPMQSHVNSAMSGICTIRAHGNQEVLCNEFFQLQNVNTCCAFLLTSAEKWMSIVLDLLSAGLVTAVSFGLILSIEYIDKLDIDSSKAGLSLMYTLKFISMLQFVIRMSADLENQMISYERVIGYSSLPQEAEVESSQDKKPPPEWPQYGRIQINNASLKYSKDKTALKNITVDIKPAEKIGIVGRTGAGKSSLFSMLFRLWEISDGEVLIDGINISQIGLDDLRKVMTILPQDPVIFEGTVKYNVDPTNQCSDAQIWDCLTKVNMLDYVREEAEQLNFKIDADGSNLSVGQKHLLCLARFILSKSRIILIDEATAKVDNTTDKLIQTTLQRQFETCTVLTIAHRLDTVMECDRILVMHEGQVVEFDTPANLQLNRSGYFSQMLKQRD